METLRRHVASVGDPDLKTVQQGGRHYSSVHCVHKVQSLNFTTQQFTVLFDLNSLCYCFYFYLQVMVYIRDGPIYRHRFP